MPQQLLDLVASDVLLEMAYTQKKTERVIIGLEPVINDHLLKLWIRPNAPDCEVLVDNLVNWIDEIGEIVLRPNYKRPPHIFYYKLLFFEPFGGGAEIPNILRRLRRLHRQGFSIQTDTTAEELLKRLQTFHRDLSSLWASKLLREDQIRAFLDNHISPDAATISRR